MYGKYIERKQFHPKCITKVGLNNMLIPPALGRQFESDTRDQKQDQLATSVKTRLSYIKQSQKKWAKTPECMAILKGTRKTDN